MKNIILTVFFLLMCLAESTPGCSTAAFPLSKFDETEYIFIGTVRGYTEPLKTTKFPGKAVGLVVKLKESVYLPKTPKKNFEIYPIELWADCSVVGTDLPRLQKGFPVNSEVRVIAKTTTLLPASGNDDTIRLELGAAGLSSISLNVDEKGKSLTSATSVYDYKRFDHENGRESPAMRDLPNFEARKDLLRLRNSAAQPERNSILERFMSVPQIDDLEFYGILRNYAASETEADRYYEANIKEFGPEFYEQYIGIKNARLELTKRGYNVQDVKEAMDRAMSDGAGFTAEEIIKGSLKYLPAKLPHRE